MEFLTGLSLKTWLIIAVVLVGAGFYGKYEYDMHQLAKAQGTIKTQGITIANQADTIKTDGVVAGVKEEVHVAVAAETKTVVAKHKAIAEKAEVVDRQIEQRFDVMPKTATNVIAEQAELSSARIDSVWESYCTASPNSAECQAPATSAQGDKHA